MVVFSAGQLAKQNVPWGRIPLSAPKGRHERGIEKASGYLGGIGRRADPARLGGVVGLDARQPAFRVGALVQQFRRVGQGRIHFQHRAGKGQSPWPTQWRRRTAPGRNARPFPAVPQRSPRPAAPGHSRKCPPARCRRSGAAPRGVPGGTGGRQDRKDSYVFSCV